MTTRVGVLRTAAGLAEAIELLGTLDPGDPDVGPPAWETSNVHTISTALAAAAALRTETRGSHWREDFPDRDDAKAGPHRLVARGRRQHPRRVDLSPSTDPSTDPSTEVTA